MIRDLNFYAVVKPFYNSTLLWAGNMYFKISRIFNLGQSFNLEFGRTYIDGGTTHFFQYFNAKDISFLTVSNAKAWRLFFEINYTIYSYLPIIV